ncbi:MAG TPA: NAD-dependent epimerase/dehydratase family protein [Candidatus Paceibacterota bacterium]|nr:NAD-dependent epimerase/dehydratase family protein [Candidatus Paceibacterota bacterium]
MKCLVTGGAGFIGSNITDELIRLGHKVIIIDNLSLGKREYLNPEAKFHKLDIRDYKKIKPLFRGIDCVFHLAAQPRIQPSIINPAESFDNNVLGTFNVLLAAKESGVKKVVYSASSSAYGDQKKLPLKEDMIAQPKNPYALFKYMGEEMCELFHSLYGLPVVCLRYFNVYGERQSTTGAYATVIGIFLKQKKSGKPLTIVGNGKQLRDFTYVVDVARANVAAMKSKKAIGHLINIGSGHNYSVNEVAKMIDEKHIYIPPRPGESRVTLADISKAEKLLGWKPRVSLEGWLKKQV